MLRRLALMLVFAIACAVPSDVLDEDERPVDGLLLIEGSSAVIVDAVVSCAGGLCTFDGTGSVGAVVYEWRACVGCQGIVSTEAFFTKTLSPKTRTWTVAVFDGQGNGDSLAFTFTSPDGPGWPVDTSPPPPPPQSVQHITGVGCSNTHRAFLGLARQSGFPKATPGFKAESLPGGTPSRYLRLDAEKWPPHDRWMAGLRPSGNPVPWAGWRQPTGDALWVQICLGDQELVGEEMTRVVEMLDSVRLYRPETVIVISGLGIDVDNHCDWAPFPRTEWVADSLVARGYGIRGPSVPLVSADFADACHPGTSGQNKWGQALQTFFNGLP